MPLQRPDENAVQAKTKNAHEPKDRLGIKPARSKQRPFRRTIERNMALTTVRELVQEWDGNFHFSKADIPFVDRCLGLIELSQSQRHSTGDITFGTGQPCSAR